MLEVVEQEFVDKSDRGSDVKSAQQLQIHREVFESWFVCNDPNHQTTSEVIICVTTNVTDLCFVTRFEIHTHLYGTRCQTLHTT